MEIGTTGLTYSQFGERCFSWSRRRRENEPAHSRITNTTCNNTYITINGVHGGIRLGLEDHMDELYIINLQSLRHIVRDKALARRTVPQRRNESEGFDGRDLVVYSTIREQTLRKCNAPLHDSTTHKSLVHVQETQPRWMILKLQTLP